MSKQKESKMERLTESCFYGSLFLPPIVFVYTIWRLQRLSASKRALVGGLFACAIFASLMILAVSIFLRDGLGPDAVESHGIDTLINCWDGVVLAIIVGAVLVVSGIILATYKEKNAGRSKLMVKGLIYLCLIMGASWIIKDVLYQVRMNAGLRPNVFSTTYPKWLFDSGYRFDFDAREALIISNWITTNQTGWEFGSEDEFAPQDTQLSADNYSIQIGKNKILIQYYKSKADFTDDPSDSFIIITRPLTPSDQAFWAAQVNEIKASQKVEVKLP